MNWLLSFMLTVFTKVGNRLMIVYCLCGESAIVPTYNIETGYTD